MALVDPIKNKQHLLLVENHLKARFAEVYWLIWRIGIETGYRISDICELRYENIDFEAGTITIAENKGTRMRRSRERLKVLAAVKNEMIALHSSSPTEMMKVFITPIKDIYEQVPDFMRPSVDARIEQAMGKAKEKIRTARLSERTLQILLQRQSRYQLFDEGYLFHRRTLNSNRARNEQGLISRQACWKVFSQLTSFVQSLGEQVKVGCHTLRKIFARHLYFATGKDIGLLMRTIGHASPAMSLRYIGISGDEELNAQSVLFDYFGNG